MKKLTFSLLAAASLSLAAASSLHAQTILNPSFESPATTGFLDNTSGDNWTQTGATAIISNGSKPPVSTPYGTQALYLRSGTSDAQTISGFTLGVTYRFTLAAAPFSGYPGALTLSVSGGGAASQSYTVPARGGYLDYTVNFIPTTASSVTFSVASASSTVGSFVVDDVRVGLAPLVPEPSTWAAVAAGAGLLGVGTLRRRRARLA